MRNELLIDELNNIRADLTDRVRIARERGEKGIDVQYAVDTVLDLLIMAYAFGSDDANDALGTDVEPDGNEMYETIYRKVADKDFRDRVAEYAVAGSVDDIMRVAETETTRDYNDAAVQTAIRSGVPAMKRWQTMKDDRVRDTHDYLQGIRVPVEARFYTYDGDSAAEPGGFTLAENNCNCRCWLTIEKE